MKSPIVNSEIDSNRLLARARPSTAPPKSELDGPTGNSTKILRIRHKELN